MFYAAMYALKGRANRRAATALQQLTGVDLGGMHTGISLCRTRSTGAFQMLPVGLSMSNWHCERAGWGLAACTAAATAAYAATSCVARPVLRSSCAEQQ